MSRIDIENGYEAVNIEVLGDKLPIFETIMGDMYDSVLSVLTEMVVEAEKVYLNDAVTDRTQYEYIDWGGEQSVLTFERFVSCFKYREGRPIFALLAAVLGYKKYTRYMNKINDIEKDVRDKLSNEHMRGNFPYDIVPINIQVNCVYDHMSHFESQVNHRENFISSSIVPTNMCGLEHRHIHGTQISNDDKLGITEPVTRETEFGKGKIFVLFYLVPIVSMILSQLGDYQWSDDDDIVMDDKTKTTDLLAKIDPVYREQTVNFAITHILYQLSRSYDISDKLDKDLVDSCAKVGEDITFTSAVNDFQKYVMSVQKTNFPMLGKDTEKSMLLNSWNSLKTDTLQKIKYYSEKWGFIDDCRGSNVDSMVLFSIYNEYNVPMKLQSIFGIMIAIYNTLLIRYNIFKSDELNPHNSNPSTIVGSIMSLLDGINDYNMKDKYKTVVRKATKAVVYGEKIVEEEINELDLCSTKADNNVLIMFFSAFNTLYNIEQFIESMKIEPRRDNKFITRYTKIKEDIIRLFCIYLLNLNANKIPTMYNKSFADTVRITFHVANEDFGKLNLRVRDEDMFSTNLHDFTTELMKAVIHAEKSVLKDMAASNINPESHRLHQSVRILNNYASKWVGSVLKNGTGETVFSSPSVGAVDVHIASGVFSKFVYEGHIPAVNERELLNS